MENNRITIRFSQEERKKIDSFCKKNKVKMSDMIRQMINKYPEENIHIANDGELDAIYRLSNELNKIGNNLNIRISTKEKKTITHFCTKNRVSISKFIRQMINKYPEENIHIANDDELDSIYGLNNELNKIGNNLNQLTHYFNLKKVKGESTIDEEEKEMLKEVLKLTKEYIKKTNSILQ
jgi:hypothetical protein